MPHRLVCDCASCLRIIFMIGSQTSAFPSPDLSRIYDVNLNIPFSFMFWLCPKEKKKKTTAKCKISFAFAGSAGLGISLKGNQNKLTGKDMGVFVRSVLHGGAACQV